MAAHDARVELKNAPVTVSMHLKRAHDPKKHLMLRVEGISVEGEVGLWEVHVGGTVAGTLSTYGAEEQNGKYVASVPLDMVRTRAVSITFVPATRGSGTIRIRRLRLVEE